jgi:mannose-6-phosphate isomerase-like protein (cupin superfamily)
MPNCTRKNFEDVADSAGDFSPDVEARFARSQIDSEHLGVTYLRYAPDARNGSGHRHREQEEVYVVLSGSGRMKLDDEIIELRRWDVIRVAPETMRGFEGGPDWLELLAIGSDRPDGGDGHTVKDWWVD